MSSTVVLQGRGAYPGVAEGIAIVARDSIPGWGAAFDMSSGQVIEIGNGLYGQSVKGRVLILNGSRGSTGFATQFHRLRLRGGAPVALVIPRIDSRTASACVVSKVPAVTDFASDILSIIKNGDWIRVDGDQGTVHIEERT